MKRKIYRKSMVSWVCAISIFGFTNALQAQMVEVQTQEKYKAVEPHTVNKAAVDDILTTMPPGEELKCTGGTKKSCTSKFAFPCPKGWSACPLTDGNKTCCKQNSTRKLDRFTQ